MEIKNAVAGTLESGDIMVQIAPGDGLQVELQSSVAAQFGRQIKALITETLPGLGIDNAYVKATDTEIIVTCIKLNLAVIDICSLRTYFI